jgi:hypothetical protein
MKGPKRGALRGRLHILSPPPDRSTRLGSRERADPPPHGTHRPSIHIASQANATALPTAKETVNPSVESQADENLAFGPPPLHEGRSGMDRSESSLAPRTRRSRNRRNATGIVAGLLPSASVLGTVGRFVVGVDEALCPSSQPTTKDRRSPPHASLPSTEPSKASSPRCIPGCPDTSAAKFLFRMPRTSPR